MPRRKVKIPKLNLDLSIGQLLILLEIGFRQITYGLRSIDPTTEKCN